MGLNLQKEIKILSWFIPKSFQLCCKLADEKNKLKNGEGKERKLNEIWKTNYLSPTNILEF